jgi:flagellar hook-associated protein 3 FlgL
MRVTQNMMNLQMLQNLSNSNERMMNLQNVLASGKRINTPSDDPVGVNYALRYRAQLNHLNQFKTNADAAVNVLDFTDSTIGQVTDVLQRARELAVQGANDTLNSGDRQVIAKEVEQLFHQLVQLGNAQFNGKYIFNGQKTDVKPFSDPGSPTDPTNSWANFDTGSIDYLVSDGVTISVNITADKVFGANSDADNAFTALNQLYTGLQNNDTSTIQNALDNISTRLDKVLAARADVGARSNRVNLIEQRLNDMNTNYQKLLSSVEDADIAKTITDLKTAENVQQASLAVGARILVPTLVDFLK